MGMMYPRSGLRPPAGTGAEGSPPLGNTPAASVASALSTLAAFMGEDDLFRDPFAEGIPSAR